MSKKPAAAKKSRKSPLRKLNDWLHLWLGLASGIVVFIVSITGCLYVFEEEIKDLTQPWRKVEARDQQFLPPSQLMERASAEMPGKRATGLSYSTKEHSAAVGFGYRENGQRQFTAVFLDPYSGEVLKKDVLIGPGSYDFFRFVIDGHRALWLPYEIGRPVVGIGTIIFVLMLITGIVMWWPKKWNPSNLNKSFKIKWKASFKRVNYDLHNVLGFYSLIIALIIALTGLVMSFDWFAQSVYYATSGGKSLPAHEHPHSDVSAAEEAAQSNIPNIDKAWYQTMERHPEMQGMFVEPPAEADDPLEYLVYHKHRAFYDRHLYFYDQYTLEELENPGHAASFEEAGFADKLEMLNYDMHIGSALGLPGKVIAFFASLISASLPITGFLVWWNKKKKKNRKEKNQSTRKKRKPAAEAARLSA